MQHVELIECVQVLAREQTHRLSKAICSVRVCEHTNKERNSADGIKRTRKVYICDRVSACVHSFTLRRCARPIARLRVCARARVNVRASTWVCVRLRVYSCARACVRTFARPHGYARVCAPTRVRARACTGPRVHKRVGAFARRLVRARVRVHGR